MKISKKLLAAVVVTTIATGGFLGINTASAHGNGGYKDELVTKLAQKFNVDASEVESVFEAQQEEREAQMQTKRSEHLQSLVDTGKITAEQKTALIAKFEEMHTLRESLRDQDLTREQMHDKMKDARDSFEAWAKDQGIDLDTIRPEGKGFGGHGHRGEMNR